VMKLVVRHMPNCCGMLVEREKIGSGLFVPVRHMS